MGRLTLRRDRHNRSIDILIPGWGEIEVYVADWWDSSRESGVLITIDAPPEINIVRREIREDL